MSLEATTYLDLVETYWTSCWNARETDRLREIFHDPYTHGKTRFTPDLLAQLVTDTVASFSDFRVTTDEVHDLQDTVITRSTFSGTHDGDLFGFPGTGKPVQMPTLDIFFFEEGKVSKYWHLTDHLPILEGIGAEVRLGEHEISWE